MKPIRLTKHAQEQRIERGATESEVCYALLHGCREPAKRGREICRYSFPFNKNWQGKFYALNRLPL